MDNWWDELKTSTKHWSMTWFCQHMFKKKRSTAICWCFPSDWLFWHDYGKSPFWKGKSSTTGPLSMALPDTGGSWSEASQTTFEVGQWHLGRQVSNGKKGNIWCFHSKCASSRQYPSTQWFFSPPLLTMDKGYNSTSLFFWILAGIRV